MALILLYSLEQSFLCDSGRDILVQEQEIHFIFSRSKTKGHEQDQTFFRRELQAFGFAVRHMRQESSWTESRQV